MSTTLRYSKKEWAIAVALECILKEAGTDTPLDITLEHRSEGMAATLEAVKSESLDSQVIYTVEIAFKSIAGIDNWHVSSVVIKYLNRGVTYNYITREYT